MHGLIRIAIVSRIEIERQGLRSVLTERSLEVVGTYRDHVDLDLAQISQEPGIIPVVIVDSTADEDCLTSCRHIRKHWPRSKIVIIAATCPARIVLDAFRAGIDGYIVRQVSVDSLVGMLHLVALGEKMIPAQAFFDLDVLKQADNAELAKISISPANLSDREVQIMQALIRGEANKTIARKMVISEATVKVHVKSILRKTGVMNRTQAAIWGISRGISDGQDNRGDDR